MPTRNVTPSGTGTAAVAAATVPATPTATPTNAPPAPSPDLTSTPTPIAQISGEPLTVGLVGSLDSLNPLADLNPTLGVIGPLLFQSLNQLDPATAAPMPGVADLPQIAEDGLTLTYTLPPDGLGVDAVRASVEAAIWPELDDIRVASVTQNTISVSLAQPDCALVDQLAQLPVLTPETAAVEQPAGGGPFVVEQWDAEAAILYLAVNDGLAARPHLETIVIQLFENEATAWNALLNGDLDLLSLRHLPDALPSGYKSVAYPAPLMTFISFNHQDQVMANAPVRQALALALDRMAILEHLYGDGGALARGPLHVQHWAADPSLPTPMYDLDQANTLLDEAGLIDIDGDGWRDLADGAPWTLGLRSFDGDEAQAIITFLVSDAYRRLGIRARPEPVALPTLLDDLLTRDYQAAVYSLPLFPALDLRPYWHSEAVEAEFGLNMPGYANPQLDIWLDEANRLPGCDGNSRADLYAQIQQLLVEEQAVDFLFSPSYFLVAREGLQGLKPGPFAPFTWNVAEWYWLP